MPVRAPGRPNCSMAAQLDASTSTWRSSHRLRSPGDHKSLRLCGPLSDQSPAAHLTFHAREQRATRRLKLFTITRNTRLGSHELGPSLLQLRSAANLDQVVRQRLNAAHQCFQIYRTMLPVETEHAAILHHQPEHLRPAAIHAEIHHRHAARHCGPGRLDVLRRRSGIRWLTLLLNRLLGIDPKRLRVTDLYRRSDSDHRQCNRQPHLETLTHCHDLSYIPEIFWTAQHPRNRRSAALRIDLRTVTDPGCCSTPPCSMCKDSCSDAVSV